MLKACFYDPESGEFKLGDAAVMPHLITAYLDYPPQPIWDAYTKGYQPVVGNQSIFTRRRAQELPRLVLNAQNTGDLDLENDYLNVLVISGKGWEVWKVKAKYVLRDDIRVLVPLAEIDTSIPAPPSTGGFSNLNSYREIRDPDPGLYGRGYNTFGAWVAKLIINSTVGAPRVSTSLGFVVSTPSGVWQAFLFAQDEHGLLVKDLSYIRLTAFYENPSAEYFDSQLPIINFGNGWVTSAPAIHTTMDMLSEECDVIESDIGFTVQGYFTDPLPLNGRVIAPSLFHPTITKTYTYRWVNARFYKPRLNQPIHMGVVEDPRTYSITFREFTGVWKLPSDYTGYSSSQGVLLSQVGVLIDRFVHPHYQPQLNFVHMHPEGLIGRCTIVPPIAPLVYYNNRRIYTDIPAGGLPAWYNISEDIWTLTVPSPRNLPPSYECDYIFMPTDLNPCLAYPTRLERSQAFHNLIFVQAYFGPTYIPLYKEGFAFNEIPVLIGPSYAYTDTVRRMFDEGILDTPETITVNNNTYHITRYLRPASVLYNPYLLQSNIKLRRPVFSPLSGVVFIATSQVIATRTYTPPIIEVSLQLTTKNDFMIVFEGDLPYVHPEPQLKRTLAVGDYGLAKELAGKLMTTTDGGISEDRWMPLYYITDVGRGRETLKVLVWQPVWLSHSFTADRDYGDTLMQFGWKITTIASPPQTEYVTGGIVVGSAWFQNLLRRLRGADLKDADKHLLRDCVCSLDGFWGAIRVTVHYDKQSGLIYMREWRLGVPYGSPVPLTTFSLQPYHEIRAIKDVWAWAFYVDIMDTRTQTIVKRIKVSPTRVGWRVSDVSPSQPIAFTHRKSFVNPLIGVNPSSPYRSDRILNFHHIIGRSPHTLNSPNLTNINDRIYAYGNYPQRFYPLKAPVENLRGVPQQFKDAAQKVYGSQVPVVPVQFGNLNARPIYVAHIPMVVEVRAKRDVPSENIAKWNVGMALFMAGDRWVEMLSQGLADLGELLHWTVTELWESEP
jgi:hypothetical protein